ncbi:hypothetical protein Sbal117_1360 [Shewanella baltica OS117]|nr:hypothetical protein Sbal117_1360 [Shewanella baltica OS117]
MAITKQPDGTWKLDMRVAGRDTVFFKIVVTLCLKIKLHLLRLLLVPYLG